MSGQAMPRVNDRVRHVSLPSRGEGILLEVFPKDGYNRNCSVKWDKKEKPRLEKLAKLQAVFTHNHHSDVFVDTARSTIPVSSATLVATAGTSGPFAHNTVSSTSPSLSTASSSSSLSSFYSFRVSNSDDVYTPEAAPTIVPTAAKAVLQPQHQTSQIFVPQPNDRVRHVSLPRGIGTLRYVYPRDDRNRDCNVKWDNKKNPGKEKLKDLRIVYDDPQTATQLLPSPSQPQSPRKSDVTLTSSLVSSAAATNITTTPLLPSRDAFRQPSLSSHSSVLFVPQQVASTQATTTTAVESASLPSSAVGATAATAVATSRPIPTSSAHASHATLETDTPKSTIGSNSSVSSLPRFPVSDSSFPYLDRKELSSHASHSSSIVSVASAESLHTYSQPSHPYSYPYSCSEDSSSRWRKPAQQQHQHQQQREELYYAASSAPRPPPLHPTTDAQWNHNHVPTVGATPLPPYAHFSPQPTAFRDECYASTYHTSSQQQPHSQPLQQQSPRYCLSLHSAMGLLADKFPLLLVFDRSWHGPSKHDICAALFPDSWNAVCLEAVSPESLAIFATNWLRHHARGP